MAQHHLDVHRNGWNRLPVCRFNWEWVASNRIGEALDHRLPRFRIPRLPVMDGQGCRIRIQRLAAHPDVLRRQ